jgi:hypothetical protein
MAKPVDGLRRDVTVIPLPDNIHEKALSRKTPDPPI